MPSTCTQTCRGSQPQAPPLYQLALILYRLAHQTGRPAAIFLVLRLESVFLPLALFKLMRPVVGGVHLWTDRALKAIHRKAPEFIPWPTAIQRAVIKEAFERNYGIPDYIGLMDGCHVNLKAQPAREDAGAFHCWKRQRYFVT